MFLLICFDIFINFTSKSFSYHLSFRDSFLFFACRYEIWKYEMQIWNLSPRVQLDISIVRWAQSWAIESNARREIPYLRAPAYCSLCNFLRITLTADLMLPIFFYCFVIFPLLSCWISSANNLIWIFVTFVIAIEVVSFWFGLFKLVILI